MTPDEWVRVTELFEAAAELEPSERWKFLAGACAGNALIEAEVKRLLAAEENRPSGFLRSPAWLNMPAVQDASGFTTQGTAAAPETPMTVIGRYHLLQKIGEGGMGEVWLAEQREPVRRRVALKLIKTGMSTVEVIARFESERQTLALMDHPAIAKVFDADSTPQGTPYFVMEYVAGVPITAYCDQHRLSTRERLELFVHVCEGVQHAHQKAIIHRDLKPSNILVTEVDGKAAPKIIDFGVAKALAQKLSADTIYTRAGAMIGTPEYMSPEQALSSSEDIDTRTDVYSLGVIFYELLAGAPPIELRKVPYDEFLRRLRELEAPKPSTKLRMQAPATSTEVASKRQTEPQTLVRQLRGDLDSIALKALEKDRARRYGSPSDFAADIGRTLRHETVLAVPPSVAYRARKFSRRYRVALATVAAFLVVLITAAVVSIRQSIRANREAAVARAVNDFLQNDLLAQASAATQSGPSANPDPDLKVRTALDRAAARIGGKFAGQPEVEAAIRDTLGQTYMDLGIYPEARNQLKRALDLDRSVLGAENQKTVKAMSRLGTISRLQGNYPDAESLLKRALDIQERELPASHPERLYSMNSLANVYDFEGKYALAESLDSRVLEIRRHAQGPEHPDTLSCMNDLANVYDDEGKYPQAEALYSQAIAIQRRVLGPEHPATLRSMGNLAAVYDDQGKYDQAEELYNETLDTDKRVLGIEHPQTLIVMNNLATLYFERHKYAQAEALHSKILEISRRVLGPNHPHTLLSMNNLAEVYVVRGEYEQATELYSQTYDLQRQIVGDEHPDTLRSMDNLASVYAAQRQYERAETLYKQTVDAKRRVLGNEHPATLDALAGMAFLYQREGKYALAETYATQALDGRRRALSPTHQDTMASVADLALADASQGKFLESEALAREAMETNRKTQPDDWQTFRAESLLGASLAGQKKYAEAESLLVEGYQGMLDRKDRMKAPDWYHIDRSLDWIIKLYREWDKPEKVAEWRKRQDAEGDNSLQMRIEDIRNSRKI